MTDWNPALYSRFETERTRPAVDLLARVALEAPRDIVDLGCGPGNSTELLVRRYPQARVVGVDNSAAMLAAARERVPAAHFEHGDMAGWMPAAPLDLIFANASLQWVPEHERLLPGWVAALRPGGALAVQMPDNLEEPSHTLMRDVGTALGFASALERAGQARAYLLRPEKYYDLLSPLAEIDAWRTTYFHRLEHPHAIVEWLSSTGLRPYLDALTPELRPRYLAEYERRIDMAYPARADGSRLLAFPRLFMLARRSARRD